VSDKADRMSELSKYPTGSKSSGSLKNALESSDMMGSSVGSTEAFAGMARTVALETTSVGGLSNGQTAGEHISVDSLWSDVAAIQLSSSDMLAFPATSMPLYAPVMVRYDVFNTTVVFCQ